MTDKPFTEEDFGDEGSSFEEFSREGVLVIDVDETSFLCMPGLSFSEDYSQDRIELEEVSESDRKFVRVGSLMESIYGRRMSRGGSRYWSSLWI